MESYISASVPAIRGRPAPPQHRLLCTCCLSFSCSAVVASRLCSLVVSCPAGPAQLSRKSPVLIFSSPTLDHTTTIPVFSCCDLPVHCVIFYLIFIRIPLASRVLLICSVRPPRQVLPLSLCHSPSIHPICASLCPLHCPPPPKFVLLHVFCPSVFVCTRECMDQLPLFVTV